MTSDQSAVMKEAKETALKQITDSIASLKELRKSYPGLEEYFSEVFTFLKTKGPDLVASYGVPVGIATACVVISYYTYIYYAESKRLLVEVGFCEADVEKLCKHSSLSMLEKSKKNTSGVTISEIVKKKDVYLEIIKEDIGNLEGLRDKLERKIIELTEKDTKNRTLQWIGGIGGIICGSVAGVALIPAIPFALPALGVGAFAFGSATGLSVSSIEHFGTRKNNKEAQEKCNRFRKEVVNAVNKLQEWKTILRLSDQDPLSLSYVEKLLKSLESISPSTCM